MIETDYEALASCIYGVTRLVSGYNDWRAVQDIPDKRQWLPTLISNVTADIAKCNEDPLNTDPKQLNSLMRKLRGYQQLATIEKFCFDEVEW